MGKYRTLGTKFDNVYRNDLNANFDEIDKDIKDVDNSVRNLKSELDNAVETVSNEAFNKVVDAAKITWTSPVDTVDDLPIKYPDAEVGLTAMVRDTGKVYRYDGLMWKEIQDIDPTAINEVDSRLTSQLAQTETELQNKAEKSYFWKSAFKNVVNPKTGTPQTFYDIVENKTHPYFSVEILGKDQSAQYDIRLYKYEPKGYEKTVFIVGGIHGDEPYPSYFIAKLFDLLISDDVPPQLQYIKNKVRLLAIPVANPWGMYQSPKTRWNSRGVNINRNFDWRFSSQPIAEPFTANYKGTSPFSEIETQHIQTVFRRYNDISAFIDYHDLVSLSPNLHYVIFADDKTDSVMQSYIKFITKDVSNPNGIYETSNNDASANNWSSYVMQIPSVNIEGLPSYRGASVGSPTDVNGNFNMFANGLQLIVEHFKKENGSFSTRQIAKDYLDDVITLTSTHQDIVDSVFSFTPQSDGFVVVNGFAMGKQTSSNEIFAVRPVLEQPGFITQHLASYLQPYTTGQYPLIPVNITIPVVKGLPVNFKLQALREGTGTCHFKRFNISILFTTSNNKKYFTIMDSFRYTQTNDNWW